MSWIQQIDGNILLWVQEHLRGDFFTPFWKCITFLGNAGWFWIVLGLLLICFKKTRPVGITALISLAVCFIATNLVLKNIIARPRPFDDLSAVIPLIIKPVDYSFPSGHTCASFASAFVYYRRLPKKYGIAAIVLATMIAFSRIYLGVHYPADILGGILVAYAGSKCTCKLMEMYFQKKKENGYGLFAEK